MPKSESTAGLIAIGPMGTRRLSFLVVLWSIGIIAGFLVLMQYSLTPGQPKPVPLSWPSASGMRLATDRPTLLMFLHPQCPCSSASLEQLNRVLARSSSRLVTHLVFFQPGSTPDSWRTADLWSAAARIPGVLISADADGREVRRFGAATSGTTFLFDPMGRLLFQGGITAQRGHAADNAAADALLKSLSTGMVSDQNAPVFGCPLFDQE